MKLRMSTIAVTLIMGLVLSLGYSPTARATEEELPCNGNSSIVDGSFGKNVPVILIHGVNGEPNQWNAQGGSSICSDINQIPGIQVALNFAYRGFDWGNTGARLATQIDAISQASIQNGGRGKVIVVGFSLGTAIARNATTHTSADGQRSIGDQVGQIVAIAAPNTDPASNYPAESVVRAIAGDIVNVFLDKKGVETGRVDTLSDTLISVSDATRRYSSDESVGGGKHVISCEQFYEKKIWPFNRKIGDGGAPCEHGNLLKNTEVHDAALDGVRKYAASLPPLVLSRSYTVGNALTIHPDATWGEPRLSIFGPTLSDGLEITNLGDNNIVGVYHCSTEVRSCMTLNGYLSIVPGTPASITVGGRMPDDTFIVNQPANPMDVWCFTASGVCITTWSLTTPTQKMFTESTWQ